MIRSKRWTYCAFVLCVSILMTWPLDLSSETSAQSDSIQSQDRQEARQYLNEGVKAFTEKKYDEAAQFFERAVQLDPDYETVRMYLATTYTAQFIPGSTDPNSQEAAYKAIGTFKQVVVRAPDPARPNMTAMLSIAALYYQLRRYPDSKHWCEAILKIDPNNPEAHYRIGVMAFDNSLEKTSVQGELIGSMSPDERAGTLAVIDEGLQALERALEIRPNYFEAMEYQNLLWREKAKFERDAAAKAELINKADLVAQKALALRLKVREQELQKLDD